MLSLLIPGTLKKTVLLPALVLILTAAGHAQQVQWKIEEHNIDPLLLQEEMESIINSGFIPSGLTSSENSMYVLYLKGVGVSAQEWGLKWYLSSFKLSEGIKTELQQGFVPADVSYENGLFFVLYIKTSWTGSTWTFVSAPMNVQALSTSLEPYIKRSFIPAGICVIENKYWVLMVQRDERPVKSFLLSTLPAKKDTLLAGINATMQKGYLPCGIHFQNGNLSILFVKY
ncbi:MAG: hypothetical protein AB1798_14805 [Spirochaetota bacterium]